MKHSDVYRIASISKQAVHHKKGAVLRCSQALLAALIADAHALREVHPGCGVEKMYYTLAPEWIGRDKCCRLLMEAGFGLKTKHKGWKTTYSVTSNYPNLIEGMMLSDKNQLWQTDITYFDLEGRWHYLVFIVDVYTKIILGYCASDHLRAEANIHALKMALKSEGTADLSSLVHHSDRGSQYHDTEYLQLLGDRHMLISMAQKAQDNAYAERVNGIIKNEYLQDKAPRTLQQLKRVLKTSVEHYNEKRIHNALPQRQSPRQFEQSIVHLSTQKRPKVIVYTDGYPNLKAASSRIEVYPEKNLRAPVCPIMYNQ